VLLLVAARLPSLAEPAGGDQSLYAYVGQRIDAGDVPYRDAWDQKPPGVHFIYAALWRLWPHDSVVAAADLVAAGLVAGLLVGYGRRAFDLGTGVGAACLFLVLGNPAIERLSGTRVRSQCETFIALAVTAAVVLASRADRRRWPLMLAGVLLGVAFWLKYNAIVYGLPLLTALLPLTPTDQTSWRASLRPTLAAFGWVALGFIAVALAVLVYFGVHGALGDLWLATITYNLAYSQETYRGLRGVVRYIGFPIERASTDALWYLGGLGCLVLVGLFRQVRAAWVTLAWIAAACLSIAINGARNLPQYFLQANPALALAAAVGLSPLVRRRAPAGVRLVLLVALAAGLWKVGDEPATPRLAGLPGVIDNTRFDLDYALGRMDRAAYLTRFQLPGDVKFVPRAAETLAARVRETTQPTDRILVFGFAASVYVHSGRAAASRFFWSRPVEVEFGAPRPAYGSAGLLADLERNRPAVVALQRHWGADLEDPVEFFLTRADLRQWLEGGYTLEDDGVEFAVWRRRSRP
jgi:hypothetical protein